MKKFVLAIVALVMISSLAIGIAGCSNVNQINFLHVVARDHEKLTYDVQWIEYDAETGAETSAQTIGEMTYTFDRLEDLQYDKDKNPTYKDVSYTLNGKEFIFSSGGVLKTEINITSGTYSGDHVVSEVLFQNAYSPLASKKTYTAVKDADMRSYTSSIDYTGKQIAITVNGVESTFKKANYTYDNESLYFMVRGSDLGQSSYSLSVAGVNNLEGGTRSVSIAKASDLQKVKAPLFGEETKDCYMVRLTAAASYGNGTHSDVYFLQSYKAEGVDMNKLPVRIDEGNVRYVLKAVSTTKE